MVYIKTVFKYLAMAFFSFNEREVFLSKILYFSIQMKAPLRLCLFINNLNKDKVLSSQEVTNIHNRIILTDKDLEISGLNNRFNSKNITKQITELNSLYKDGYLDVTNIVNVNSNMTNKFIKDSYELGAYNSQVPLQSSLVKQNISNDKSYFSFDPGEVAFRDTYKFILSNQKLKNLIISYLGNNMSLYSINTMVTTLSEKKPGEL